MAQINLGRVGFVNKGTYVGGTTLHKVNDIVEYNSSVYACITEHSTEHLPTDALFWTVWADNSNIIHKSELSGAIGNINSPLLDLPLQNSLAMN